MADKFRIELISAGIQELLKSTEIQTELKKAANSVKENAGDEFEIKIAGTRAFARVQSKSKKGYKDNQKNNTLLKALGGGK